MVKPHVTPLLFTVLIAFSVHACHCALSCRTDGPRKDCGFVGIDEAGCASRGCCWDPVEDKHTRLPWCFFPNDLQSTYEVINATKAGHGYAIHLEALQTTQPELGEDLSRLLVTTDKDLGADTLHVKITASGKSRYEVPKFLYPAPDVTTGTSSNLWFSFASKPFSFGVHTTADSAALDETDPLKKGQAMFDTKDLRLIFKEQYLEITSSVSNSSTFFGLGETTASQGLPLLRDGTPVTLWNRDRPSRFADENLYGSYPFLLELRKDGTARGIFLLNSNGMDIVLTEDRLSFRMIGGVLDFYFFGGPTPADVLEQYTRLIGRPKLPPFWSLGFHQCKFGYKNVEELEEVVEGYRRAEIPLDTMWTDIDYMDSRKDFTLDPGNFSKDKMQEFVAKLHDMNMRYVVIIDPGIKAEKGYPAYEEGLAADIFVKDVTGAPYLGQVWPGPTHFPDFLNPAVQAYWDQQFREFHMLLPFDGIWIDMNEISNFCSGEICHVPESNVELHNSAAHGVSAKTRLARGLTGVKAVSIECNLKCKDVSEGTNESLLHPPYAISNAKSMLPLSVRTLPTTASHSDGYLEYDVHNLYGLAESRIMSKTLETVLGRRSFALTRSTFPGSGAYVAHWTGDNAATWEDLRWSISMILNSGLNGIPFVGADICGFQEDTNEELCSRWISAGAFVPFARDHSDIDTIPQELYRWDSVATAARKALGLRYELLSYIGTAFRQSSINGAPVARPLWFSFPKDTATHQIDQQWMLGDSLLISPVLYQGKTRVSAYIPEGIWYDGFALTKPVTGPGFVELDLPLGSVPVHFKGGSIIPLQKKQLVSVAVHSEPFDLVITFPALAKETMFNDTVIATGDLFYEDGNSIEVEDSSVDIKLMVLAHSDPVSGLEAELKYDMRRPATESGDCTSIDLPRLDRILLIGWPGDAHLVSVSQQGSTLQHLKWQNEKPGRILIEDLSIDWKCNPSVTVSWAVHNIYS